MYFHYCCSSYTISDHLLKFCAEIDWLIGGVVRKEMPQILYDHVGVVVGLQEPFVIVQLRICVPGQRDTKQHTTFANTRHAEECGHEICRKGVCRGENVRVPVNDRAISLTWSGQISRGSSKRTRRRNVLMRGAVARFVFWSNQWINRSKVQYEAHVP